MIANATPTQVDEIEEALTLLIEPGQTFEIRVLKPTTTFRWFTADQIAEAAREAHRLSEIAKAKAVYVTLNAVDPDAARKKAGTSSATADADILCRHWILVDLDTVKPKAESSSTEEEKGASLALANEIMRFLRERGFACLVLIDSGNGFHVLIKVDLPADDGGLVRRFLEALAAKFDNDRCKVDIKVANASRITKLPGTFVRKGKNTADRPHRFSKLLEAPEDRSPVAAGLLKDVIDELAPKPADDLGAEIERKQAQLAAPGRKLQVSGNGRPSIIDRARRWLAKSEESISGQRGHDKLLKASKVGVFFDLTFEETVQIIRDGYNTRLPIDDRWSDPEIRHKVSEARKLAKPDEWGVRLRDDPQPPHKGNGRPAPPAGIRSDRSLPQDDDLGQVDAPINVFANYALVEYKPEGEDQKSKFKKEPFRLEDITAQLDMLAPGWPKRVDKTLFWENSDYTPIYLDSPVRLYAWLNWFAEIDWAKGNRFIPQERFYEHLRMKKAEKFDAIEHIPHWPPMPSTYYMHPPLPAPSSKLDTLLDFFCPASAVDRELIKAFILTLFWGGQPGSRPAFLITGPDDDLEQGRGVGKTRMPSIIAEELAGGSIDVATTDEIPGVITRMLSESGRGARIAMLDNVKTHRLSWADLEGLITKSNISGRMLYQGEGQRPNTITWVITLNGPSLSKDMAQRVIPIKLARPKFDGAWESNLRKFIQDNRWEIIAEIGQILQTPAEDMDAKTRWAAWERGVIWRVIAPAACLRTIVERQGLFDDDNEKKEVVADYFAAKLLERGHDPDTHRVFIPTGPMAQWVCEATRKPHTTNDASCTLGELGIPQLKKGRTKTQRGWIWAGINALPTQPVVELRGGDYPAKPF